MTDLTSIIIIIFTFIAAIIFIIIANYKFIKGGLSNLDFKNIITQLIALTAWVTILGKTLLPINPDRILQSVIIFVTSIIIGGILIHNLGKEVTTKKEVSRLIKKLEENNDKLKELDKQKSEFVSLASHQLRGPISIIQGYISMLLEGDYGQISDDVKAALQKVFQTGTGLNFLINDYLDVSKLDKGEIEYILEDINISEFIEKTLKSFEPIFIQNKVKLIKIIPKNDLNIRGDINKTRQIISNIVDNSLKYTPTGSIEIELKNDSKFATISVKDTGIGIPVDKLNNIFKKFNRTEQAISQSVTGTGLGLYVAKIMTESQGGKIWAESKGPGFGSTFYIKLPLAN